MRRTYFPAIAVPTVGIGLLLLAGSLLSLRYLYLLQQNSDVIVRENVPGLEAAQELEIQVRQLRFHNFLYLLDPDATRLAKIHEDETLFEEALGAARSASISAEDLDDVEAIERNYADYKREQAKLREPRAGPLPPIRELVDSRPIRGVVDPCRRLFEKHRASLANRARENQAVTREAFVAMLFLGVAGPLAGLAVGYLIARGLRQSIYRLTVKVHDIAQQLDRDLGSVDVAASGDLNSLEKQIGLVVRKVEDAMEVLQRQQRELLRAEQLSQVGQLAASVAHEIRNPLTGVKLLVDAALRPSARRTLEDGDLRVISREVRRMEHSVQTLLDFARLPEPQRQSCDLRPIVDQAWELARVRCEQQGVVARRSAPNQPAMADVDPTLMTIVVVNLLFNALDAMPTGGTLETDVRQVPDAIEILVADTGAGIDPAVADRLFMPFATSKASGTGLGLFLSKRILEEHGGTIEACDRPTGGALFLVRVPASGPN